jgi:transmembrane sensor
MTRAPQKPEPDADPPSDRAAVFPILEGSPLPEQVTLQAAQWLVTLQAPDTTQATWDKWQRWRDAHPDHERAWRHIEASTAHMRAVHSPLAHGTLIRNDTDKQRSRRRAVKLLAAAAFTSSGMWLLRDSLVWREWHADHHTATGERRTVVLANGTQIILNTASVIDVHFDDTVRLVTLIRGEILVTTAHDTGPGIEHLFIVETSQGRLRALGTPFAVRQRENDSHISMFKVRSRFNRPMLPIIHISYEQENK